MFKPAPETIEDKTDGFGTVSSPFVVAVPVNSRSLIFLKFSLRVSAPLAISSAIVFLECAASLVVTSEVVVIIDEFVCLLEAAGVLATDGAFSFAGVDWVDDRNQLKGDLRTGGGGGTAAGAGGAAAGAGDGAGLVKLLASFANVPVPVVMEDCLEAVLAAVACEEVEDLENLLSIEELAEASFEEFMVGVVGSSSSASGTLAGFGGDGKSFVTGSSIKETSSRDSVEIFRSRGDFMLMAPSLVVLADLFVSTGANEIVEYRSFSVRSVSGLWLDARMES